MFLDVRLERTLHFTSDVIEEDTNEQANGRRRFILHGNIQQNGQNNINYGTYQSNVNNTVVAWNNIDDHPFNDVSSVSVNPTNNGDVEIIII